MTDFEEKPFKVLIRKLPDPTASKEEQFPYFYEIVLNRNRKKVSLEIFLVRLKPYYYSIDTVAEILGQHLSEKINSADIEFMVMNYCPTMKNNMVYTNSDPLIHHPLWSCKSGI